MIPVYNSDRANVRNAYSDMLLQEAVSAQHKKLHDAVLAFIKKNKSAFKDIKAANKIADAIKTHKWDIGIIGLVADLSNTMKDSADHQEALDKIIDMV